MSRPSPNYQGLMACLDADPELFYPADRPKLLAAKELAAYNEQVAEAKDHCAVCPFREACRRGAIERGEEFGIWGGTTPEERRKLRQGVVPLFDPEVFGADMAVAA